MIHARQAGLAVGLHHGFLGGSDEAVDQLQARTVDLLLARVPPQGKVLDVGSGSGEFVDLLRRRGNRAAGILPDASRLAVAHARFGADFPVQCARWEEFREEEGSWDALTFRDSTQCVPAVELFARASALLKDDGELLVLDEFAREYTEPGQEDVHHKEPFLALAGRFGFVCREEVDCTEGMLQALDGQVSALENSAGESAASTGVGSEPRNALLRFLRHRRDQYRQGSFGYFLLRLQRQSTPRWRLARIGEKDQPAVSALFREAFGQELTPAMWRWKYGQGRGTAIGVWLGDKLIAHYGGFPRRFFHDGELIEGCQNGDLMVAANMRGLLVRQGPLFQAAATFTEQHVGFGRRYLLPYGFPNQRSYGLLHRLGIFSAPVVRVLEARWAATGCRRRSVSMRDLDPAQQADADIVDGLWGRMAGDAGSLYVGVRDAAYCRERYREHPQCCYRIILARHRWLRHNLAVLVVKSAGDRLELLDWVAEAAQVPLVVDCARMVAERSGQHEVYLMASDPVVERLRETSPQLIDLKISVPYNSWTNGPSLEEFRSKLWLTGGDADFH